MHSLNEPPITHKCSPMLSSSGPWSLRSASCSFLQLVRGRSARVVVGVRGLDRHRANRESSSRRALMAVPVHRVLELACPCKPHRQPFIVSLSCIVPSLEAAGTPVPLHRLVGDTRIYLNHLQSTAPAPGNTGRLLRILLSGRE